MLERGKRRKMSDSRYRAGLTAYKKKKVMANQRLGWEAVGYSDWVVGISGQQMSDWVALFRLKKGSS
jgi:hypothetical protein